MKKACEELHEVQRQVTVRRHLLESGAIRINRTSPKSSFEESKREERAKEEREPAHK
jgi:hypothetical protein